MLKLHLPQLNSTDLSVMVLLGSFVQRSAHSARPESCDVPSIRVTSSVNIYSAGSLGRPLGSLGGCLHKNLNKRANPHHHNERTKTQQLLHAHATSRGILYKGSSEKSWKFDTDICLMPIRKNVVQGCWEVSLGVCEGPWAVPGGSLGGPGGGLGGR